MLRTGRICQNPADGTNPYPDDYYRDPARWAFEMQMFLLTRRYRAQKYAQGKVRHKGGFVVLDRSYYGDVCFANVQLLMGYFTRRDYETYLSHHTDMKVHLEPPAVAIFLNVPTETCKERINRRLSVKEGRRCESGISLEYLNSLDREIDKLADGMAPCTLVKRLAWGGNRSEDEIAGMCGGFALGIKARKQTVHDFWTGTDGIGK